jgi:alpha-1,2-mannosyltransferase
VVLAGAAALTAYLLPGLPDPAAHWPMWDVSTYWWGGQRAARHAALYYPGAVYSFTYPPFAAALFGLAADASADWLKAALTVGSSCALPVLCWLSLGAAGLRRRPETVFAVTALALRTFPVSETLHLGETDLIVAALVAADVLGRRDGGWWQGIATGLAAGFKLTPLIFIIYLAITGRVRAAATAATAFAATVVIGLAVLPSASRTFWLDGVFLNARRIGIPANPADQSLSGVVARLGGHLDPARPWWLAAELAVGLAGIAIAARAHRHGGRLAGAVCCAITGLLLSPISWTHHWVWAVPLLIALTAAAWRHRSPGYALAAITIAVVFSGKIPMPWPGHPLSLWPQLESDLYVLCGLAVLTGTALTSTAMKPRASPDPEHAQAPGRAGDGIRALDGAARPTSWRGIVAARNRPVRLLSTVRTTGLLQPPGPDERVRSAGRPGQPPVDGAGRSVDPGPPDSEPSCCAARNDPGSARPRTARNSSAKR